MDKYRDTPMDLAGASLVAIAERRANRRLFTIDSHLRIHRLGDGPAFQVIV